MEPMISDLVEFGISDDGKVTLKRKTPEPTNVFEWCWEHSQAEGDDRRVLLYLAFHSTGEIGRASCRERV